MVLDRIREMIAKQIGKIAEVDDKLILSSFSTPPNQDLGDIAFPCFKLSKDLKKAPPAIAALLIKELKLPVEIIYQTQVQGGYLNFFIDRTYLSRQVLSACLAGKPVIDTTDCHGKVAVIDFSSPNIAKPFHVGHLGSTIIGESLARIHEIFGYKVIRVNHLGDWGVQNGYQVLAWNMRKAEFAGRKPTIDELCDLYIWINAQAKENPEIDKQARNVFKEMEAGNKQHLEVWNFFRSLTIEDLKGIYERLDVTFDSYNGEAFYEPFIAPMLEAFSQKDDFLVESDGAKVVFLNEYGIEAPCIVMKSDGASIYATRDLATAIWRQETYKFDKNIYVTDLSQMFHFKQFFHVLKKFGHKWADNLTHVPYGFMSYRNETGDVIPMSTRAGTMIPLNELMERMKALLLQFIVEKNPSMQDKEKTADTLGINAIKFWIQSKSKDNTVIFDWAEATNPQGKTGPYLNYTFARTAGILDKLEKSQLIVDWYPDKIQNLTDPKETKLVKKIDQLATAIGRAKDEYEPAHIANYLIELAQDFNSFYFSQKVMAAENEQIRHDRACLVKAVNRTLAAGMALIGLIRVDQM